jgi:ABC-type transporter lipoprotein component MlaA
VLEGAALDAYSFRRDAYFQRQRNIQYDGNPPEDPADSPQEDTTPADPSKDPAPATP